MKYRVGSRFIKTDLGLVRTYLRNMVEKKESRFITTMDIYKDEPWLLHHVRNSLFYANEWYYFVPRTRRGANGVTPNRIVPGRGGRPGGFWKSTGKMLNIMDREHRLMGHMQHLTYNTGVHGNSVKTDWLMTEYTLPKKKDEFQELVLCFIRLKKKTKDENLGFVDVFVPQPQPQPQPQLQLQPQPQFQVLEGDQDGVIPQQQEEVQEEEEADLIDYADNLEMMMLEGDQDPEQQQQQQEEEILLPPPVMNNDNNNINAMMMPDEEQINWDIHDANTWAMLDFFLG